MEQIILTDKLRIESLENWVLKQDSRIKKLTENESFLDIVKDKKEFEDLKKRIFSIESDWKNFTADRKKIEETILEKDVTKKEVLLKCEHCDAKFQKAIQLKNPYE